MENLEMEIITATKVADEDRIELLASACRNGEDACL